MAMQDTKTHRFRRSAAFLLAFGLFAVNVGPTSLSSAAYACAFDIEKPERTAIDRVLDAQTLVLARPDQENAFAYEVVEVLRGPNQAYDLPLLVHAVNRRLLKQNPDSSVLLGQSPEGDWAQIAYVDGAFNDILRAALASAETWRMGYPASRFAVFEALQDSDNTVIQNLAIAELDKASYGMLQNIDLQISTEDLLSELWTIAGYPYQPIRVLLLGLSDDDRARDEIYNFFARSHNWDWANNIGAFSAALIELEGVDGVAFLEKTIHSFTGKQFDKLPGIVSALAVQRGVANPELALAIDQVLARLVVARPETAPVIAQQFSKQSNWSQKDLLEKMLQEKQLNTMADMMVVSIYVAQARGASQ